MVNNFLGNGILFLFPIFYDNNYGKTIAFLKNLVYDDI